MLLRVDNIEKYYGRKGAITKVIDCISFEAEQGEFMGIMGPSGSGKTTLLNCISTIDLVTTGHIYINDQDITTLKPSSIEKFRREQLGFVFQDYNLLDTLSGYENIALALTILGIKSSQIHQRVMDVASRLNAADFLNKFPSEISGGQKQLIAIARAIVTNPVLILADEPTGALDSRASRILLECFKEINEHDNTSILMVTHDPFTASYCKRILFIKDGKIFNELRRGTDTRRDFFNRIIEVMTLLGGEVSNVL